MLSVVFTNWAVRYNIGLLIKETPKGVVFSFLFLSSQHLGRLCSCSRATCHPCRALQETFGETPTFAALQGKTIHLEGEQRPFKRCLAFQAIQSRHAALSQGRINPADVPEIAGSAWSNNTYSKQLQVRPHLFVSHVLSQVVTILSQ